MCFLNPPSKNNAGSQPNAHGAQDAYDDAQDAYDDYDDDYDDDEDYGDDEDYDDDDEAYYDDDEDYYDDDEAAYNYYDDSMDDPEVEIEEAITDLEDPALIELKNAVLKYAESTGKTIESIVLHFTSADGTKKKHTIYFP